MLVGYVSNENYEALSDVTVEFRQEGSLSAQATSSSSGAVHADIAPGEYEVTLQRSGYRGKKTTVEVTEDETHDFRLLSSERMYGYAWPKWTTAGETGEYRIHSPLGETKITLWRYGLEKEFVEIVAWYYEQGPQNGVQKLPDGDFTQGGVDWSSHRHDFVSDVEAPSESGLYYFHMEAKSTDEFFSFPWVVAPAEPTHDVAVLASTNTWNAYNGFGGRSNYVQAARLPDTPVVHPPDELDVLQEEGMLTDVNSYDNSEYEPLSFERPCLFNHIPEETEVTDPIRGWAESHNAPAEWRTLGWLEREGFEYDLYADHQLHTGELDLDAYNILLLQLHPEYWSETMYRRVKDWVFERGGKLLIPGGNGIDCEIEFIDETKVRHLTDKSGVVRDVTAPANAPDNSFESRFHKTAESQGELVGTTTTGNDLGTAAPYEVRDSSHWVFEDTDLETGDLFGTETLMEAHAGGASGDETDKLSRFAPDGVEVIAKGTNPNGGGGDMALFETPSGGAVFNASSCAYAPALLVDDDISTITRTVLERFAGSN